MFVDPVVTTVGIDEAEALLHDPADPGFTSRGRDDAGAMAADAVVGTPRTGTSMVNPIGTRVAKLMTASQPRIARATRVASKRSPMTGSAPLAATTAAALDERASPRTVCPASWSAGMVDRPMTPLAPVGRTSRITPM